MSFKKWVVLFLVTAFTLSACHSPTYRQAEGNVADVKIKAAAMRHKFDAKGKPKPSLIVREGLYVDTTPISLDKQPSWMRNHIVIRGDRLPFSYYSRTIAGGAGSNVLTRYQTGLDPAVNVTMNYTGTVKGALDILASKAGYVYTVSGNHIEWQAFLTRTFDVAFMPGSSDYLMGKTAGGSGAESSTNTQNYTTSDASNSEYSNLSAKLSVWRDLDSTIKQMLSPDGKVVVSESTTSVMVRDRPTNIALIAKYISNLNNNLSKQVLVKIQVLEVTLEDDFNFGINWQLIANTLHNSPFTLNASYGTPISITALTPQQGLSVDGTTIPTPAVPQIGFQGDGKTPSYTALLNALNQQAKTSIVSEPRVVCLNNQVSVVRIVTQEGYIASIENTTAPGTTGNNPTVTSQVTPGNMITGLTLYILPKILNNNIYLQLNADLSVKLALVAGGDASTGTQVQLPKISQKHFNQRSLIHSGDTLILSGFRQVTNSTGAMQFLQSQALGGKASQQVNTETIVLITPIVLNGSA